MVALSSTQAKASELTIARLPASITFRKTLIDIVVFL
jgi:hypothetical protein